MQPLRRPSLQIFSVTHTLVPARQVPFPQPLTMYTNQTVVANSQTQQEQNSIEWASQITVVYCWAHFIMKVQDL